MTDTQIVPKGLIESKICVIRGKNVMLDHDLAELYDVTTKVFNQAVKRNIARFPEDFMFQVTTEELNNLRSQSVTSRHGGRRYLPYAFTESGVAMLSSVLNSDRAIKVNIQIMRIFTRLREMMSTHEELKRKIEAMESKYDDQFQIVFNAIKTLLEPPAESAKGKIGFRGTEK